MEPLIEQLIETFLTRGGKVFIAPQYSITAIDNDREWSCPDFVALDFENREVVVIEVTSGADIGPITRKAKDREKQWFTPLRHKLKSHGIADGWSLRFLGFVRRESIMKARSAMAGHDNVSFFPIEDAAFPWKYWDSRINNGLPKS